MYIKITSRVYNRSQHVRSVQPLSKLGVAPAGFGAGSAPPIPSPFNLSGLIFYQTRDPDGFGSPTGTHHGSDAGACGEE